MFTHLCIDAYICWTIIALNTKYSEVLYKGGGCMGKGFGAVI